jgi:hypothetical protein
MRFAHTTRGTYATRFAKLGEDALAKLGGVEPNLIRHPVGYQYAEDGLARHLLWRYQELTGMMATAHGDDERRRRKKLGAAAEFLTGRSTLTG